MGGKEPFLLGRALVFGRLEGIAELAAEVRRVLRQLLLERLGHEFLSLGLQGFRQFLGFSLDGRSPGAIGVGVQCDQAARGSSPSPWIERRFEHGAKPVIVGLGNRVVPMVVALGASDGQSQEGRADDLERIGDDLVGGERFVGRTGRRPIHGRSKKARGGQRLDLVRLQVIPGTRDQLVASQLLDDEPIERLVHVE